MRHLTRMPTRPLLFILAIDALYHLVDQNGVEGLRLPTETGLRTLQICGYADDAALYLRSPSEAPALMDILGRFGTAACIRANASKSNGMWLGRHGSDNIRGIPMLRADESCRYLGIMVGVADTTAVNWTRCMTALRVRLRLA